MVSCEQFASMRALRFFFASTSRDKKIALRAHGEQFREYSSPAASTSQKQDPLVRTASSGRILKLPNRFYRKHGLIKAQ